MPPSLLQQEHLLSEDLLIYAQLEIHQEAQRHLQAHKLGPANTAHLGDALLRPLVVFNSFAGYSDRGQGQPMYGAVGCWYHEIGNAEAVAVGCRCEVYAWRVWAELMSKVRQPVNRQCSWALFILDVQTLEVLRDCESWRGLRKEAPSNGNPLQSRFLCIYTNFHSDRLMRMGFR